MVRNLPLFMSTYHAFVHGFLSSDSHPGQLASETSKHLISLNHTHPPRRYNLIFLMSKDLTIQWPNNCEIWFASQVNKRTETGAPNNSSMGYYSTTTNWDLSWHPENQNNNSEQYRPGWSSNNSLPNIIMVVLCCSALQRHHCYYLRRFSVLITSFSEGPFPQELNLAASFPRVEAAACNPPGECSAGLFRGSASNTRFTSSSISKSYTSSNTCWSENEEN